ncbi:MAG: transposase, partial [Desulfatirhabdiaceae bacterium]
TSLTPDQADPERILNLARGHWAIENRLHWVRDVTFDEDRSQVRKGNGAQIMASLRNIAISLLRMAGARYIAPALRACARLGQGVLRLIGVPD